MSNVTDIYDKLSTLLSTSFSSKTVIPNPFDTAQNNDNLLKNGYGFYYGGAGLPTFNLPSFQGYAREFVLVLTREVYRTDADTSLFGSTQKSMLEDQYTFISSLAKDRTLDNDLVSVEFTGDSGIEFIYADKFSHLRLISTFEVQYKEDVSYCYP